MEAAATPIFSSNIPAIIIPAACRLNSRSIRGFTTNYNIHESKFIIPTTNEMNKKLPSISRISAAVGDEVSAVTSDPVQAEITWQIVLGALAGVTPFVVAGIEFSKRIVEQRQCKMCKGSGLVQRDNKYYFRCSRCGGFLPWQSWRRFFTG